METDVSGEQVKCWLCEEEFPRAMTTVVYGATVYEFCSVCTASHNEALKVIEKYTSQLKTKKLKQWLEEQRAVKRFYKRQLTLPLES